MCFNEVMNHPDAATCEEPDMYYCFCRVPSLSQAYKNCACRTCPSVVDQVIDDGLDLCEGTFISPPLHSLVPTHLFRAS